MPNVKIPPRGSTSAAVNVTRVAHGFDFRIALRTLGSQRQDKLRPGLYPWLALWNYVSQVLRARGVDLVEELEWLPPLKHKGWNQDGEDR